MSGNETKVTLSKTTINSFQCDRMVFRTQVNALELLDEATEFLSKLIANNSEDASTLTEVSSNLLLGLGNILHISSQDASVIAGQQAWYKIDKDKVLMK